MATGTDITSGKEVAIKLTDNREGPEMLRDEAETYRRLAGEVGIPQVYWFGEEVSYYVLVFELLGPSLEDLFNYCDRRFSLKTILLIAEQAVSRIERIHKKFLHGDIKPDNFLLGLGRQGNTLYTIDFGLAREFSDKVEYRGYKGLGFQGTDRYASIKCHNGQEQSWGDDLECLGYMLVYFARGSLPWQGLQAMTTDEKRKLIKERKESLSGKELCKDALPDEFAEFIDYTRSLKFGEKPKYAYLLKLFRNRFQAAGFQYDNVFDWTLKRFHEIHGQTS
ncbi:casein kinase 1, delta [Hypoxylon argillaceum]|nr:casein kinase 1, delta [Hypoxylon argillaceum]